VKVERTQQRVFVEEALTTLFHRTPEHFLGFLNRDGNIFLRFYWDRVGQNLKLPKTIPYGLDFEFRKPERRATIALITLPEPKVDREAFFVALIYRPYRVTPFLLLSDTTKIIVLERHDELEDGPGTLLVEWTRRMEREVLGKGPLPVLEHFYRAVIHLVYGE